MSGNNSPKDNPPKSEDDDFVPNGSGPLSIGDLPTKLTVDPDTDTHHSVVTESIATHGKDEEYKGADTDDTLDDADTDDTLDDADTAAVRGEAIAPGDDDLDHIDLSSLELHVDDLDDLLDVDNETQPKSINSVNSTKPFPVVNIQPHSETAINIKEDIQETLTKALLVLKEKDQTTSKELQKLQEISEIINSNRDSTIENIAKLSTFLSKSQTPELRQLGNSLSGKWFSVLPPNVEEFGQSYEAQGNDFIQHGYRDLLNVGNQLLIELYSAKNIEEFIEKCKTLPFYQELLVNNTEYQKLYEKINGEMPQVSTPPANERQNLLTAIHCVMWSIYHISSLQGGTMERGSFKIIDPDNRLYDMLTSYTKLVNGGQLPDAHIARVNDFSYVRQDESLLGSHLSTHDPMCGIRGRLYGIDSRFKQGNSLLAIEPEGRQHLIVGISDIQGKYPTTTIKLELFGFGKKADMWNHWKNLRAMEELKKKGELGKGTASGNSYRETDFPEEIKDKFISFLKAAEKDPFEILELSKKREKLTTSIEEILKTMDSAEQEEILKLIEPTEKKVILELQEILESMGEETEQEKIQKEKIQKEIQEEIEKLKNLKEEKLNVLGSSLEKVKQFAKLRKLKSLKEENLEISKDLNKAFKKVGFHKMSDFMEEQIQLSDSPKKEQLIKIKKELEEAASQNQLDHPEIRFGSERILDFSKFCLLKNDLQNVIAENQNPLLAISTNNSTESIKSLHAEHTKRLYAELSKELSKELDNDIISEILTDILKLEKNDQSLNPQIPPLYIAAQLNQIDTNTAKKLLKKYKEKSISYSQKTSLTPLYLAAIDGNNNMVKALIEDPEICKQWINQAYRGINQPYEEIEQVYKGQTPLEVALDNGHTYIVSILLQHGAKIGNVNNYNEKQQKLLLLELNKLKRSDHNNFMDKIMGANPYIEAIIQRLEQNLEPKKPAGILSTLTKPLSPTRRRKTGPPPAKETRTRRMAIDLDEARLLSSSLNSSPSSSPRNRSINAKLRGIFTSPLKDAKISSTSFTMSHFQPADDDIPIQQTGSIDGSRHDTVSTETTETPESNMNRLGQQILAQKTEEEGHRDIAEATNTIDSSSISTSNSTNKSKTWKTLQRLVSTAVSHKKNR